MAAESTYFHLENLDGKHNMKEIKRGLDELHGVTSVSVNTDTHYVAVDYDGEDVTPHQIEKKLCKMGYVVSDRPQD